MRSIEVVLNQPLSEVSVKDSWVRIKSFQLNELFLKGSIESFVVGIVLWGMNTAVVLLNVELQARYFEVLFKLCSIVMAHPRNLAIKEVVKAKEKVLTIL